MDKYYHMIVTTSEKAGFIANNLNIEYLNNGINDYTACWVCSTDVPIEMVTYMGHSYYFDDVSEAKDFYKKSVLKFNNNKRCYYNRDLRNKLIASHSTMNIKFSGYSFDFGTQKEKNYLNCLILLLVVALCTKRLYGLKIRLLKHLYYEGILIYVKVQHS